MEYCTIIWSPHTAKTINKLERIQRRATKFILKTDDDYGTRVEKLCLMFYLFIYFFEKVLNGHAYQYRHFCIY